MMRLGKTLNVGGRDITVREFDAETAYQLLRWLEKNGGAGLKAHELLALRREILAIVAHCIEPVDGKPLDVESMGLSALLQIADGLQEVNQAFLEILTRMKALPLDTNPAP